MLEALLLAVAAATSATGAVAPAAPAPAPASAATAPSAELLEFIGDWPEDEAQALLDASSDTAAGPEKTKDADHESDDR